VFVNGHKKLGGRRVGTPNKATISLRERIEALDPLGDLIALARAQDTSPELKAKVLLKLLSYNGTKPAPAYRWSWGSRSIWIATNQGQSERWSHKISAKVVPYKLQNFASKGRGDRNWQKHLGFPGDSFTLSALSATRKAAPRKNRMLW